MFMTRPSSIKILIYAFGNPGRMDDGLGNEFVNQIEYWAKQQGLHYIDFDSNYQLNIEDAETVTHYDIVLFVDASTEEIENFCFTEVDGKKDVAFTSHAASPGFIVNLCHTVFKKYPQVFLLHIKGYEWEFREGLTSRAKKNLSDAVEDVKKKLRNPELFSKLKQNVN